MPLLRDGGGARRRPPRASRPAVVAAPPQLPNGRFKAAPEEAAAEAHAAAAAEGLHRVVPRIPQAKYRLPARHSSGVPAEGYVQHAAAAAVWTTSRHGFLKPGSGRPRPTSAHHFHNRSPLPPGRAPSRPPSDPVARHSPLTPPAAARGRAGLP